LHTLNTPDNHNGKQGKGIWLCPPFLSFCPKINQKKALCGGEKAQLEKERERERKRERERERKRERERERKRERERSERWSCREETHWNNEQLHRNTKWKNLKKEKRIVTRRFEFLEEKRKGSVWKRESPTLKLGSRERNSKQTENNRKMANKKI